MSLFVMLMSIMTFAQQVKPEVVVSKHTFIVHSTTHSLFSDDYRNSIPINLPENTISWYYAVSTYNVQTSNNSSSGNGLLSGLASLAGSADPVAGIALNALNSKVAIVNEAECHVYLLDEIENRNFMNYNGFRYYEEGTRKNFNGGIVNVKNKAFISGTWYLGFENPRFKDGVKIELEVVALVLDNSKPSYNATTSNQTNGVTITSDPEVKETEINIYNNTEYSLLLYFDGAFMEEIPPMESTAYDTENATYKIKCIQKGSSKSYNHIVKFTNNGQSAEIVIGD